MMGEDNWDFYFCTIDDQPHSTFVNLTIGEMAPIAELPIFHGIDLVLHHPNPENGMTTNTEFERLCQIEDMISAQGKPNWAFVARQTGKGLRRYFFYADTSLRADAVLQDLRSAFPDYTMSHFSFEDTNWDTYLGNLYPNPIAWNEISNRHVYESLREHGDDLNSPREIDHTVIFTNSKAAQAFEVYAKENGYKISRNSKELFKKEIRLLLQKEQIPSKLDPITYEIRQQATGCGGVYDGWGCSVVSADH